MENKENMIEFLNGEKSATVTFTNQKYINKIKKLYDQYKAEFSYYIENDDGSVCAKIPLRWIKVSPPRQISEEQRNAASERFKKLHEEQKL